MNRTLGYAYDDYCIAQLAKALGRHADYEYFMARSSNYRLLFDPITGFMRARRLDGSWVTPFNPTVPFGQRFYREGTAWHYLWLVPHDIEGLINLLGGRDAFIKKLDEFFDTPYNPESPMRDLTGMLGQYVHGNETDRQVPYYYNYARNASEENIYIQSATLNGKTLNRPYFHHSDLIPGGRLVFEMGPIPNKEWGAGPEAAPPSVTPILMKKP